MAGVLTAMERSACPAWTDRGHVENQDLAVVLSTGKVFNGKRHSCFKGGQTRMVGKCFDLKSAFTQCPLSDSDGQVGVIAWSVVFSARSMCCP